MAVEKASLFKNFSLTLVEMRKRLITTIEKKERKKASEKQLSIEAG